MKTKLTLLTLLAGGSLWAQLPPFEPTPPTNLGRSNVFTSTNNSVFFSNRLGQVPGLTNNFPGVSGITNPGAAIPPGAGLPGQLPTLPGTPSNAPGVPPQVPLTPPGLPGATPGLPGNTPGLPGNTPGLPGNTPGLPGTEPALPGGAPPPNTFIQPQPIQPVQPAPPVQPVQPMPPKVPLRR